LKIEYAEIGARDLDIVGPLWEKLRRYQEVRSPHFARHYASRTWEARRTELLEKAKAGALHIDLAKDLDSGEVIAYSVSTVSSDGKGYLESIFVEPNYRENGIGDNPMRKALDWMNDTRAKTIVLEVGVGNEAVLSFYRRYNFHPRTIILQQAR
jgi:ribosomal protein S18 acetylase RimI-like enzyme